MSDETTVIENTVDGEVSEAGHATALNSMAEKLGKLMGEWNQDTKAAGKTVQDPGRIELSKSQDAPKKEDVGDAQIASPAIAKDEPKEEGTQKPERTEGKEKKDVDWESPEGMGKINGEKFKKIKANRDELRAQLEKESVKVKEFQARVEALSRQDGESDLVKALKVENESMIQELAMLDLERVPRFQQHYQGRINHALAQAKMSVGEEHAKEIERLLLLPDSQDKKDGLREAMAELDEFQQDDVRRARTVIADVRMEMESEKAKWRENGLKVKALREKDDQEKIDGVKSVFKSEVSKVQDMEKGWPVFQRRDGDDKWNADILKRIEAAEHFMNDVVDGKISPQALATAGLQLMSLGPVIQHAMGLEEEISKLRGQLKEYESANPKLSGGGSVEPGKETPESTFIGEYRKHWKG